MEVLGIGVDLVDVGRVERLLSKRSSFESRVFTPQEIEYCRRQRRPAECFAARWAAREACRKALGGVRGMRWQDVRVERHPSGAPAIVLEGNTRSTADRLGVSRVLLALTHERSMAGAFCLAIRG